MVDFSDRVEIKRWLDGIDPPERRHELAIAMAARAALRAAPLLNVELRKPSRSGATLPDFLMPYLRAVALAWAAARYPVHRNELRAFATSAARAASSSQAAEAAASAARAASEASASASAFAASAVASVVLAGSREFGDYGTSVAALTNSGRSGGDLASLPLWLDGVPYQAVGDWLTLKSTLLERKKPVTVDLAGLLILSRRVQSCLSFSGVGRWPVLN